MHKEYNKMRNQYTTTAQVQAKVQLDIIIRFCTSAFLLVMFFYSLIFFCDFHIKITYLKLNTSCFIHSQSDKMIRKKNKKIKILNSKAKNNCDNYMQLLEISIKYVKYFLPARYK